MEPITVSTQKPNVFKYIALASGSALSLSLMALFAKLALPHSNASMLLFFRGLFACVYILLMIKIIKWRGHEISLKTKHLGIHILRSITAACALYSLYYSLHYIPLVDANLLAMTYPLFAVLFAAIFFKEKINLITWIAIITAFVGIVLILKPGHALFEPAALIALFSGICAAISILGIHKIGKEEHTYTIMLYYIAATIVISTVMIIFTWQLPDLKTLLLLIGVGTAGILYQELLTRALIYSPTFIPSAFMYLSVVFSLIFGFIIWYHIPDYLSWFGIILVCLGDIALVIFKTKST